MVGGKYVKTHYSLIKRYKGGVFLTAGYPVMPPYSAFQNYKWIQVDRVSKLSPW